MSKYFQFFSWQSYDINDLRERLATTQPELIEWICIEEIGAELMPEYGVFVEYLSTNQNAKLKILISTPDIDQFRPHPQIEYEPYIVNFFHQAKHHFVDTIRYDATALHPPVRFEEIKFNYKFVSLNHRGHIFRCKMIDEFSRFGLFQDSNLISWNNVSMPTEDQFKFTHFVPRKIIIPGDNFYDQKGSYNCYRMPSIYNEVAFSVIAESSPNTFFVTEKTTTPMWFYKPFIVLGSPGWNHYLKNSMGFEIFEEVFDYSFDHEQDLDKRIAGFTQQVVKLNSYSLEQLSDIRNSLKEKIIHNRHRAENILYDQKFWPTKIVEWKKYMYDKSVTIEDTNRKDLFVIQTEHMFRDNV